MNIKTLITTVTLTIVAALHAPAQTTNTPTVERVGIYDSRAIAVAYAGSALHNAELRQKQAEMTKAKQTDDAPTIARLKTEGKARQVTAHKQAFSTAPVDDILAHITNALPEIQKQANVTALISKWDETALKQHPRAERVDITLPLIDAFNPTATQRKSALEIQKHKPITLKQAEQIDD
jgi:hypothetical protein